MRLWDMRTERWKVLKLTCGSRSIPGEGRGQGLASSRTAVELSLQALHVEGVVEHVFVRAIAARKTSCTKAATSLGKVI